MLDVIVCDDNIVFSQEVKKIVENVMTAYKVNCKVNVFNDYDNNFMNFVEKNTDKVVYILDVEMPSESGVDVARIIRKKDKRSIIIFLTSHQESANTLIKSRLNILTFIYKYDNYKENLRLAIQDSIDYSDIKNPLIVDDNGSIYNINFKDILYITKDGRKTKVITNKEKFDMYLSLASIKSKLPSNFQYSHRACIVNTSRIELLDLNRKVIHFDNGITIDLVSDKYKRELNLK